MKDTAAAVTAGVLFAIVVLLLLGGCAHGPPCSFALDPAFTDEERAEFEAAADEWRNATWGRADASFDLPWPPAGVDDHIIYRDDAGKLPPNKGGMAYWHAAPIGVRHQPTTIVIAPDLPRARLKWVMAHELGHHWNLRHSTHREDLMYPSAASNISARDVVRFCERQGC